MREIELKNQPLSKGAGRVGATDRRRSERQPAEGEVLLSVVDDRSRDSQGQLIDISAGGFRASHQMATLQSGQIVHFRHPHAEGVARVMWTRIFGGRVESGFLVVLGGL